MAEVRIYQSNALRCSYSISIGKTDGPRRSAKFPFHAVDNATWPSLSSLCLMRNGSLLTRLAQEYSTENLGVSQKAMLEDLRDYGLIWQRRVCVSFYCRTFYSFHTSW